MVTDHLQVNPGASQQQGEGRRTNPSKSKKETVTDVRAGNVQTHKAKKITDVETL